MRQSYELQLTGELSKTGMGDGQLGAFAYNTKITKCDLSGVTGWGTSATLPGSAFAGCTALQEVVLPGDVQVLINVILPQNDLKYHLISFCGL